MNDDARLGEWRDHDCGYAHAVAAGVALFLPALILRARLTEARRREMVVHAATVVPRNDDDRIVPVLAVRDGVDYLCQIGFGYLMIGAAAPRMIVVADVVLLAVRILRENRVGRRQAVLVGVSAFDPEHARRRQLAGSYVLDEPVAFGVVAKGLGVANPDFALLM